MLTVCSGVSIVEFVALYLLCVYRSQRSANRHNRVEKGKEYV